MRALVTRTTRRMWIHHMAIVLFLLLGLGSLCSSIMTALAGTNWAAADGQTRFLIVTSIIGNLTGTLVAFFRQQITNLAKGGDLVAPDANQRPAP